MNKIRMIILSLIIMIITTMQVWAEIPIPEAPEENYYIFDYGNLIEPAQEEEMMAISAAIERASGAEIVAVTVESLEGYEIEEYANTLFRDWGIGSSEENNGVLLLVNKENVLANKSGRIRIEVGYGLEGAIPDGKAGRILDEFVLTAWDTDNYSQGIYQGYMAIAAAVSEEYGIVIDSDEALRQLEQYKMDYEEKESGGFPSELIIAIIILLIVSRLNKGNRNRRYKDDNFPTFWGGFGGGGGGGFGSGGGFGGFGGGSSGGGGASR